MIRLKANKQSAYGPVKRAAARKVQVSYMSSFTRTIPSTKNAAEVDQILSRKDHFIPLSFQPTEAKTGDFIYLVFCGMIMGRARITSIDPIDPGLSLRTSGYPEWARWVVRYTGGWQKPPRFIPVQGHQSVRYLENQSLGHLDSEKW